MFLSLYILNKIKTSNLLLCKSIVMNLKTLILKIPIYLTLSNVLLYIHFKIKISKIF